MASGPLRPTTLEIDLDAAAGNLRAVRGLVGPGRKIFAVKSKRNPRLMVEKILKRYIRGVVTIGTNHDVACICF